MSAISAVVGSTVLFDRELWAGGVAGVGDIDIDEASDRKVRRFVSLSWTDIVFEIRYSGYRRVHADFEENGLKYIAVKPGSLLSCANVRRMDRVVIQY